MKKIFALIVVAVMAVANVKAQHELGGVVGGLNGLSYKFWFNDALALQTDLAVGLTQAAYKHGSAGQYDFTVNPNVLYHFDLVDNLKLYTGGGINFGLVDGLGNAGGGIHIPAGYLELAEGYGYHGGGSASTVLGKFGVNGVIGLAYQFDAVPVVLAFDFRPGYGLSFNDSKYTAHFFDWKLALAVRYAF